MKKIISFLIGFFLILTLCAQTSTHRISKDSSRLNVTINSNVELRTEKTKAEIQYKENVVDQLQTFNNTTIALSEAISKSILEKPPNISTIISPERIQKAWQMNWIILLFCLIATYVTLTIRSNFTKISGLSLTKGLFQGTAYLVILYLAFTLIFNLDYIKILSLLKLFG